jgi:hypothetical protein
MNALYLVQNKAANLCMRGMTNWETLEQHRKVVHIFAVFKLYKGVLTWKAISDRLQKPCYLRGVIHDRSRKQRADVGKYSSVNGTTLLPSLSRLAKQCGILNLSQPYRPPQPFTGIVLLFYHTVLYCIIGR